MTKATTTAKREDHFYGFGCPVIDIPFGGGIQSGKIIEIRGPESVGKSTLSLGIVFSYFDYWMAQGKKIEDLEVLWIETESAWDLSRIAFMRPDIAPYINHVELKTVEDVGEEIEYYLGERKEPGLIVWDTLAAVQTRTQEKENDPFAGGMMEVPRRLRALMRHITIPLGETQTSLILSNQLYDGGKDNPNNRHEKPKPQSYGGGAVKYYSSVRCDLKKGPDVVETLADNSEYCRGIKTRCYMLKNKLIRPRMTFDIIIDNENGLDTFSTTVNFLKEAKILKMAGSWKTFTYLKECVKGKDKGEFEEFKFQSDEKFREAITENPMMNDWMNYLVYKWYADTTPLTKIKLIRPIWKYEAKFFKEKATIMTNQEIVASKAEEKALELQEKRNEEKMKRKRGKK